MPKDKKGDDFQTYYGYYRNSYVEIPQPKGKFVNLFEEMRKQNEKAAADRSQDKDAPEK